MGSNTLSATISSFNKDLLNVTKHCLPSENSESSTDVLGRTDKAVLPPSDAHMPPLNFPVLDQAMLSLTPASLGVFPLSRQTTLSFLGAVNSPLTYRLLVLVIAASPVVCTAPGPKEGLNEE